MGTGRIVNEGSLQALGGRHGGEGRDHARRHAGAQRAERGERAGVGVSEAGADGREGEEADAVFENGAGYQCRGAAVEGAGAVLAGDGEEEGEGVVVFVVGLELDAGFGELEGVLGGKLEYNWW